MSKQRDRDEFIAIMTTEGVPVAVVRLMLRHGATLQRLAELECSSEAADRDRVPCPGLKDPERCLCEHWSGCGCSDLMERTGHHPVTRIARRAAGLERNVTAALAPYGVKPVFNGDPPGAVVNLKVPSGRTNDLGQVGVCVP